MVSSRNMADSPVSRLLWAFFTLLYVLQHKLLSLVKALSSWSVTSLSHISSSRSRTSSDILSRFYAMGSELERKGKLPQHIAIVLLERRISIQDLAQLIQWFSTVGVPYISLYNGTDDLAFYSKELALLLNGFKPFPGLKSAPRYEVHYGDFVDSASQISEPGLTTHVYLLRTDHGRNSLVSAAKSLCRKQMTSLTVEMVDTELRKQLPVPDPELMFKFGSAHLTLGYPPWSLRLTEMLRLPSHCHLQPHSVLAALQAYGRCEQRYGK